MFKQNNRLRTDKDIQRVLRKGRSGYGAVLGLKVLPNILGASRFAIVISNKVSKKATKRNQLRRRLRDIIRLNLGKFNQTVDVVLMVKPKTNVLEKSFKELEAELLGALKKSRLIR